MVKSKYILPSIIIVTIFMAGFVFADPTECPTNDCPMNVSILVGNAVPTIPSVTSSAITLTGGTTANAYIQFTADDANGYADLNDSSALVVLSKGGETSRTSSSCAVLSASGTQTEYNCTISMEYYDGAGLWNITATVKDTAAETATNDSEVVTVNALDYITQSMTTMTWNSVVVGADDDEADLPLTLANKGNQDYTNVSIKAYNATGTTSFDVISAALFSADDVGSATSGQTYLVEDAYTQISDITGLNTHGDSVSDFIYFYLDVPSGIAVDTYTGTTWSIKVAA